MEEKDKCIEEITTLEEVEVLTEGGTTNYSKLTNKPQINDVELIGNKTSEELGLQPAGDYATNEELNDKIQNLVDNDIATLDDLIDENTKNISDNKQQITELDGRIANLEGKDLATEEYVDNKIEEVKQEIPDEYKLPIASADVLGGIKVGENLAIDNDGTLRATASGGGGTSNYNDLTGKPSINDIVLEKNKTLDELGIQAKGDYALKTDIPDVSSFITKDVNDLTNYYDKEQVDGKVSSVYKYKGQVETYDDLEDKKWTAQIGDVWEAKDTGENYAWDGTKWDDLGNNIDLSDYAKKEYVNSQIQELVNGDIANLTELITETQDDIGNLEETDVDFENRITALEQGGGSGGGTDDYNDLNNKPSINGHELNAGENTLEDIGAQPKGNYALKSDINELRNADIKEFKAATAFSNGTYVISAVTNGGTNIQALTVVTDPTVSEKNAVASIGAVKSIIPKHFTTTLSQSNWIQSGEYFEYDIKRSDITSNTFVDISMDLDNLNKMNGGAVESYDGGFKISVYEQPEEDIDISVKYELTIAES